MTVKAVLLIICFSLVRLDEAESLWLDDDEVEISATPHDVLSTEAGDLELGVEKSDETEDDEEIFCHEVIKEFPEYRCVEDKVFGRGATAATFVVERDGKEFILKVEKEGDIWGIEALKLLQVHPRIIQLFEVKTVGNYLMQILEFGQKGNLKSYYFRNQQLFKNETFVVEMMLKVIEGVEFMHSKHLIHADLKLGNIVIDDQGEPKLIDFDLSVMDNETHGGRGTAEYIGPEVFHIWSRSKMVYNDKMDVHCLTSMFYFLLFDEFPFNGFKRTEVYHNLERKTFFIKPGTRMDFVHIFERGLKWNVSDRADLPEFKRLMTAALTASSPRSFLPINVHTLDVNSYLEELSSGVLLTDPLLIGSLLMLIASVIAWLTSRANCSSSEVCSTVPVGFSQLELCSQRFSVVEESFPGTLFL